jgi:hypothetical protein
MRIFPEICANTLWPFSNSTRNIAFGRDSRIVPSSTIASSFGLARVVSLIDGTGAPIAELQQGRVAMLSAHFPCANRQLAPLFDRLSEASEHVVGAAHPVDGDQTAR